MAAVTCFEVWVETAAVRQTTTLNGVQRPLQTEAMTEAAKLMREQRGQV